MTEYIDTNTGSKFLCCTYSALTEGFRFLAESLYVIDFTGAPGKTRTCDLLIRSIEATYSSMFWNVL